MESPVKTYSLVDLSKSIQTVIERTYTGSYWVSAEILKLNYYPKSGHCFPELVEKKDGKIVAEMRSTIWNATYEQLNQKFLKHTQQPLKDGMKVLFLVQVKYSATYGFSLNITDVDPAFTLGAVALEKQASIDQLKKLRVFYNNQQLDSSLLPNNIAIISVESSKGYHDYLETITDLGERFNITHTLYPAILQGDNAIKSIIQQLKAIQNSDEEYDLVLIIRGGGGDVGLHCYNNVDLAHQVATFPIPVITGIGHSTNFTVTEMVAHLNKITPTAVASHVVQQFILAEEKLADVQRLLLNINENKIIPAHKALELLSTQLKNAVNSPVTHQNLVLQNMLNRIAHASNTVITKQHDYLKVTLSGTLNTHSSVFLNQQKLQLEHTEQKLALVHPKNVVARGYSLTYKNNKAITPETVLEEGDELTTVTSRNTITSKVIQIKNNE